MLSIMAQRKESEKKYRLVRGPYLVLYRRHKGRIKAESKVRRMKGMPENRRETLQRVLQLDESAVRNDTLFAATRKQEPKDQRQTLIIGIGAAVWIQFILLSSDAGEA